MRLFVEKILLLDSLDDVRQSVGDLPALQRRFVEPALDERERGASAAERALIRRVRVAVADAVADDAPLPAAPAAVPVDTKAIEFGMRLHLASNLRADASYDEALAVLEADETEVEGVPDDILAEAHMLCAELLDDLGRFEEVEGEYEQALRLAEKADHRPLQGAALAGLGDVARRRGRDAESARRFTAMGHRVRPWGDARLEAAAERGRARAYLGLGRAEIARRLLTHTAAQEAASFGAPSSATLLLLGDAHRQLDDEPAATTAYRRAMAGATAVLDQSRCAARLARLGALDDYQRERLMRAVANAAADGRLDLEIRLVALAGAVLRHGGDLDQAIQLYRGTLSRAAEVSPQSRRLLCIKRDLAFALLRATEGRDEAAALLRDAVATVRRWHDDVPLDERRAEIVSAWIGVYDALIKLLGEDATPGSLNEAFDLHEAAKSRSFASGLADAALDAPETVSRALRLRETSLLAIERRLQDWSERPVGERQSIRRRVRALWEVHADLERVWEQMRPRAADYVRVRSGAPITLAEMRELLPARATVPTALVSYFCGDDTTTAFLLRSDTGEFRRFCVGVGRAQLENAASALRRAINGDPQGLRPRRHIDGRRPHKRDRELLPVFALGERLLPFLPELDGIELICIAPHGPLHLLPLHAMRAPDGSPLIAHHGVVYTPSASVLNVLLSRATAERLRGRGSAYVASVASVEDDWEAFEDADVPLDPARWEVTDDVGPEQAAKEQVRRRIRGHELVHLTCHGYFNPDRALDSGLLLSDGRVRPPAGTLSVAERRRFVLSARDLLEASLDAQLVVLRACSTGVAAERQRGDELEGLSRALLYAGAGSLLVTLWDVDQASSGALLSRFYEYWSNPRGSVAKWRALALAQRELLAMTESPWQHPFHWAPLVLIGDWT